MTYDSLTKLGFAALISLGLFSCANNNSDSADVATTDTTAVVADLDNYVKTVPEWSKNSTMYEINLRQYSEEGSLKKFEESLPRLKELGVDILWFMPIHPIGEKNRKGTMGSPYSVKDYKAIDPSYGTVEEFKGFVSRAHDMGFKVIIDWVANHSAFDNVWIQDGKMEYYTLDSTGNLQPPLGTDWWDVADLNYDNKEMRLAMIDALKFWVEECDIDGYRCDVAGEVPTDFWNEARLALDQVKPVFMLAEAEKTELHEKAFDMTYGWEMHFLLMELHKGEKTLEDLRNYHKNNKFKAEDYRLHFITNHDENAWKGTIKERLGDSWKQYAAFSFTYEGMSLMYSGQEAGLDKRLEFFEKDVIDWEGGEDRSAFYANLNKLNKENEALWNGIYGGAPQLIETDNQDVFCFKREKNDNVIIGVFNFTDKIQEVAIPGTEDKIKGGLLTGPKENTLSYNEETQALILEPGGYYILEILDNPIQK